MSEQAKVSVVVPTYQRRAPVVRLLEAFCAQTLPFAQFEVVVAIDGSVDGTREAVESFKAPYDLRAVWHENQGRAAARNSGVDASRGEVIVLLDDDMEPAPELLAAHLGEHEHGRRVGVVGAAPVRMDESTPPFARFMGVRFNDVLARLATPSHSLGFAEAYVGNFSVRRADFQAIGGFDETFDGYGLEDYELALRLTTAGVTLVLSTDALAHQSYDKSFAAAAHDSELRGRSIVTFAALHPSAAAEVGLRDQVPPSIARRLFRYVLPWMTRVLPTTRTLVVRSVAIAERSRMGRLPFVYELGLEYFSLLGFQAAARDRRLK